MPILCLANPEYRYWHEQGYVDQAAVQYIYRPSKGVFGDLPSFCFFTSGTNVNNIEHVFRQDLLERTSPKWMGNDSAVRSKLALKSISGTQRLKLIQPISRDGDIIPPRRHC